ncbi:proton-conducting membrane transporter [Alkalibaculum sp. M08DMB]|uniref:Proton-conducting membrane transporter n=1 Tax=Alkalibaculum sporogenes TaxID=2655001 RepID=A0A6A7KBE4_9FIRM|nr:proton-conducting transporter membrane subunit [Alkalibaculum sporogenes]MPW26507.1 proton-conducting membrane transporter [Alkalibaculum sporogenes]
MINLLWLILLPITVSASYTILPSKISKYIMVILQLVLVIIASVNFAYVRFNGTVLQNIGEWPRYVAITLRADLLATVMVLLTVILFLGMVLYNVKEKYCDNLFMFLFIVLEGLIITLFLSNDLFNIFVLIEVATVLISVLIMFKKDSQSIYDGMLYLLINVVAMSFFLLGVGILYKVLGVIDLYGIESAIKVLDSPASIILPYAFIITAVSLKAALMPLFSWLPKAHGTPSAPSVISAVLSGLYVKSGIYLFIRVQQAFSSQIDTTDFFLVMGFITAVVGFILAIAQKDIKLILAYHTVSQIGLIMMGLNMNHIETNWGAIYHIINHAFFKSALFLTAGMIIDEYKTRDIYKIKGAFKRMPFASIASIFAILGITGAPLFNGSVSKYLIAYGTSGSWAEYGLILVNLGTIISFVKYSQMFFGVDTGKKCKSDIFRNSVVLALGIICFIGGIFGEELIELLFDVKIPVDPLLYGSKVIMFIITLFFGVLIYHGWLKKSNFMSKLNKFELSFNGVCLTITLFFSFTLVYLKMTH